MKGAVGGEVFTIHIISRLLGSENSSEHLSRRVTERSGWADSSPHRAAAAARSQLNLTFASSKKSDSEILLWKHLHYPPLLTAWLLPCRDRTHAGAYLNAPSLNVSPRKKIFWIHLFELKPRTAP